MKFGIGRKVCLAVFVAIVMGVVFHMPLLYAQEDPPAEDYEYADCGLIVDDSSDAPCFEIVMGADEWKEHPREFGFNGSSLYAPMLSRHWVKWYPSYKDLKEINDGMVEVFVSIPPAPCEEETPGESAEGGEETECSLAEEVEYWIWHSGKYDRVIVNQKEEAGKTISLGVFEFDGEEAWVEIDDLYLTSDAYQIADAVCFGEACPGLMDITPPSIEDVKTSTHIFGLKFYIEAKITDEGSGVASAYVEFNGEQYPMNAKGDIYSAKIPYRPGVNLNYVIVAADAAGNEAEWSPTRGYVIRGAGRQLGTTPWALYKTKRATLGGVSPAKASLSPCSPYGCDPVNMMTGNLLEQLVLVFLPGRPPLELVLTHNSQGGVQTIFGESWVHNYNSHVTEMDNADFQGVFVQYPDGKTVQFSGPDFSPEPGIYDTLERDGDGFKLTQQDKSVLYFDSYGDLTRQEDANGNGVTLTYSEQTQFVNLSKLTSIKADGGREITFEYNDKGLVVKINLPEGKSIGFEYNDTDDLTAVTDGRGNRTVYEYENHAISKKLSPEGHAYYENSYDEQRRVTRQIAGSSWTQSMSYGENQTVVTDKNGAVFTYYYNEKGMMIANVDEENYKTSFEYDPATQKVLAEINAEDKRYEYQYDDNGNQIFQEDPMGYTVTRQFDQTFNKPIYERNQNGRETRWEYDDLGNLTKIVNAEGNVSTLSYNEYGQLIESRDFNGNKTIFSYTPEGDLASVTDALGNTTQFLYDGLGRLVSRTDPRGGLFSYHYDANDNLTDMYGPLGYHLEFEYDRNNRLVKQTDPRGAEIHFEYDRSENLTARVNELKFRTSFEYGLMNEKLKAIDPEGRVTQFGYTPRYQVAEARAAAGTEAEAVMASEYNGLRLPVKTVDPEGRITLFEYDELFRLVKMTQDAGGEEVVTRYEYNSTGRIVKEIDPNDNAITYTLDELDRIVARKDAEGQVTRFEYDAQGNLVKKTNPRNYDTLYEYDALNRLVKATGALAGVTEFAYDANGNLVSAKNPRGIYTHYEYDALDRMVKKVENYVPAGPAADDANVVTLYEYDLNGNLVTLTNPRKFSTRFEYDAANRMVSITDAGGNSILYEYDRVDNRVKTIDRNGNATVRHYDELNRLVAKINAENYKTLYAYDKVGNLTTLTDPRSHATRFQYDGLNRRIAKIDALDGETQYAYDPAGNLLAKIDANSHAQRYAYDKVNRLVKATDAERHAAEIGYDENGNPVKLTDRNGNVTILSYDALDRLVLKIDALQGEWRYVYDAVGNLLTEIDANGHEDHYRYDALNRTISITDAEGNPTLLAYDPNGNKVEIIDGNGHITTLSYDALDRLVSRANAEEETTAYQYDAEGNRTNLIEADGIVTKYDYDKIYRLIAVTQNFRDDGEENADTNVDTNYRYDPNGNLVHILNPNEAATRFEYDPLNRQIKEIDAEGNTWAYQYDPVGNRTLRTDANGNDTIYSYFPDDQLQKVSYYDGTSVSYSYDRNNNRTGTIDRIGTSAWSYDPLNRVTEVNDALGRVLKYGYDPVGNRTSLSYPDGRTAQYRYYKNDWLQSLTDPENGEITYRRDGVGMTTQILNPNETFSGIRYDKVNRILQIVNKGKKVNSAFKYSYNEVGHRTSIEATYAWRAKDALTTNYHYDGLRRLVRSEDSAGVWNDYAYDRAGNRLSYATNDDGTTSNPKDALSRSYNYNNINQLLSVIEESKKPKTTLFEYDANGNRINKQYPGPQGPQVQGTRYSYDPENRLVEALNYHGNNKGNIIERDITTMDYDGLGRRLIKIHDENEGGGGAKRVEYAFDGLDPIADYNTWNPQYVNYYRGDGNRIAMRHEFPAGTQGERAWYHYDALGSVVGLTKHKGQSDHNYPYSDYGQIEPKNGNFAGPQHNDYAYTGQAWDDKVRVYEFYSRAYDPVVGVWLQLDPYRGRMNAPETLYNRYMYVHDNPTNLIDLYGRATQEQIDNIEPIISQLAKTYDIPEVAIALVLELENKPGISTGSGRCPDGWQNNTCREMKQNINAWIEVFDLGKLRHEKGMSLGVGNVKPGTAEEIREYFEQLDKERKVCSIQFEIVDFDDRDEMLKHLNNDQYSAAFVAANLRMGLDKFEEQFGREFTGSNDDIARLVQYHNNENWASASESYYEDALQYLEEFKSGRRDLQFLDYEYLPAQLLPGEPGYYDPNTIQSSDGLILS